MPPQPKLTVVPQGSAAAQTTLRHVVPQQAIPLDKLVSASLAAQAAGKPSGFQVLVPAGGVKQGQHVIAFAAEPRAALALMQGLGGLKGFYVTKA